MEKNFSWEELFECLELESNDLDQSEEIISYSENFLNYFNDYMNISYLEEIKESDLYLLNKWKRIFYSCANLSDYFYYLEKPIKTQRPKIHNVSLNLTKDSKEHSKSKKNFSFNTSSDSGETKKIIPNISSENSNSSILSLSQSKELNNSINDININFNTSLNEFKLTEAKKSLKIYDNELIEGKEFESNCRRILNIMLLFVQSDNYTFFNPCKIPLQKIIDYLKIQQFQNDTLTNADAFEIDIVINDFKVSDLQKLIKNYRTHFFFDDKLDLKNCKPDEKVNFIGEIARNFVVQIQNKFEQFKTYNATFKIFEALNNSHLNEEEKNYIFQHFKLENNKNKNIFVIITDGSYAILRFTLETITKIKDNNLEGKDNIQNFIKKEIDDNQKILEHLMSYRLKNLNYYIYTTYEALKYLEKNKLLYCILFIGSRDNNIFENFYKEKNENKNVIKFETKFKNQIKNLINNLIQYKNEITYKIQDFGKSLQNSFKYDGLYDIITFYIINNKTPKLSNYFKIKINFYYAVEDFSLLIDNDKFFVEVKKESDILKLYKKLLETKNSDSLSVFIDDKNILSKDIKNNDNNLILIINKENFEKIEDTTSNHIKNNINIFREIFIKKINDKIKYLEKNKKIYTSKTEFTLKILKEKLNMEKEKDFSIEFETLVNLLNDKCKNNFKDNIKEDYINKLIKNKNDIEKLLGKKYEKNFKQLILDKFSLLNENIKSSLFYDIIIKIIVKNLIIISWNNIYINNLFE